MLAAFSYAAAGVSVAKSGPGSGDNGAFLSIVVTALAASLVWALAYALQGPAAQSYDGRGIAWFVASGLLTIVIGRALFFKSIVHLGAIRASAVNRLIPFFSVLLAALLLGEVITLQAGAGMLLIAISFALLIGRLLSRQSGQRTQATGQPHRLFSYVFGAASALAYALGYVARKFGLAHIADSNLGTLIGAAAGLAGYLVACLFSTQYAETLKNLFATTTRWHVLAACFISVGQLSQFAAIKFIEVSRVAVITSTDIFISIFLSVYVLKTETRPDVATLVAAILATAGVALVALR